MRCPVCSKVSRPEKFAEAAEGLHDLDYALQESLSEPGKRGGFRWTFGPMGREEVASLAVVTRIVADRLVRVVDALERADRDPEQLMAELQVELTNASAVERGAIERLIGDVERVLRAESGETER